MNGRVLLRATHELCLTKSKPFVIYTKSIGSDLGGVSVDSLAKDHWILLKRRIDVVLSQYVVPNVIQIRVLLLLVRKASTHALLGFSSLL